MLEALDMKVLGPQAYAIACEDLHASRFAAQFLFGCGRAQRGQQVQARPGVGFACARA